MKKKIFLAGVVVFILWSVLDLIIHDLILKSAYASTASFTWPPRPTEGREEPSSVVPVKRE